MQCSSNGTRPSAGDFKKNDVVDVTERLKIYHSTVAGKEDSGATKKSRKIFTP